MITKGMMRRPIECSFKSAVSYKDPFSEIEVDVIVKDERGKTWKVPAFWGGGSEWKIRFAAPHVGNYTFESVCTNVVDSGLNGQKGTLEISEYVGDNKLYIHGPIRVMKNGRHFEHEDGTPFSWLGDTWWMVFSSRVKYPEELKVLIDDRVKKGFTVIQLVNGLLPDVGPFDKRAENEAGYCWTENWGSINPGYYDLADLKMEAIVDAGLVPCLAGAWGFYVGFMGLEKMKKHYRYMIARYGAYPVIWNLAGETSMLYYPEFTKILGEDEGTPIQMPVLMKKFLLAHPTLFAGSTSRFVNSKRKEEWSQLLSYMKQIDPFNRIISAHVTSSRTSVDDVNNPELLDFIMWQGTHEDNHEMIHFYVSKMTQRAYDLAPARPVVNSECNYEGITNANGAEVQRRVFWHSVLGGNTGYTYGAQGVWAASHKDDPFGVSKIGINWGNQPWQEAYQAPGGKQVGANRKFLNKYEWWRLQPAPDKVKNPAYVDPFASSIAAEIPGELVVFYFRMSLMEMVLFEDRGVQVFNLIPGAQYHVTLYNPVDDLEIDKGNVTIGKEGTGSLSVPDSPHDWVYVLERI